VVVKEINFYILIVKSPPNHQSSRRKFQYNTNARLSFPEISANAHSKCPRIQTDTCECKRSPQGRNDGKRACTYACPA